MPPPQQFQTVEDLGKLAKKRYPGAYDDLSDIELGRKVIARYPGAYDDFHNMPDAYFATQKRLAAEAPKRDPTSFIGELWEGVKATPGAIKQAVRHPLDTTDAILDDQMAEFGKAKELWDQAQKARQQGGADKTLTQQGNLYAQAFGHGLAGLIPVLGPGSARAGENLGGGKPRAGAAQALMMLGPDAAGLAAEGIGGMFRSRLTPLEAARRAEFVKRGGKLTFGQERGILTDKERLLRNVPGAAGPAERAIGAQDLELQRQAGESIGKVSPTQIVDPVDAANALYKEATGTAQRAKGLASKAYADVETAAKTDTQTLQIGRKPAMVNAQGQVVAWKPIMGTYEAPVALGKLRAGLRPLWREYITKFKDLEESQRLADPGYASLKRIMTDVDPLTKQPRMYMSAMDLEKELGAIKGQLRGGGARTGIFYTPAGRTAIGIIDEGEKGVAAALNKAQPGLYNKLLKARGYVRTYKQIDQMITSIVGKNPDRLAPEKLYGFMTRAGTDGRISDLRRLAVMAPDASKAIARTYLEGMLRESAGGTGRLTKTRTLVNDWDKIGPKTKELWFGKNLTKELDTTFHNIADLVPAEGSQTAGRIPALKLAFNLGNAVGALFTGHVAGAAGGVAELAGFTASMNLLARVLFKEGGGEALSRVLKLAPVGGPALREAVRVFNGLAIQANREREAGAKSSSAPAAPAGAPAPAPPQEKKPSPLRGGLTPDRSKQLGAIAEQVGVPPRVMRIVATIESAGDQAAVSPKDARGVMQLSKDTASRYGVNRDDEADNMMGGAMFLKDLIAKYRGDMRKVFAAYNAGEGAVDKYNGVPPYPETIRYVAKAMQGLAD